MTAPRPQTVECPRRVADALRGTRAGSPTPFGEPTGESTQRELDALDVDRAFEIEELEAEPSRPAMRLIAR